MLGIVIGVAAVITMVTVGNGATQQVSRSNRISRLGHFDDPSGTKNGSRPIPSELRLLKKQMQKPFHSKLPVFVRSLLPEVIQPLSLPMEKTG